MANAPSLTLRTLDVIALLCAVMLGMATPVILLPFGAEFVIPVGLAIVWFANILERRMTQPSAMLIWAFCVVSAFMAGMATMVLGA